MDLNLSQLIMMLLPLIIIEIGLIIFALYRLAKDNVKYLPKWAWALIIIFFNLIGPIVFLVVGREKY
jgi:competence protein ComGF